MHFKPTRMFLTHGVGRQRERLTSLELALRDAGIASYNLVTVSSIFPPQCKLVSRTKGLSALEDGSIVYAVMAKTDTNEFHRLISASIGVAIPADPTRFGYLSEHHTFGENEKTSGDYAEDLAATMLASTLGIEIDLDRAWDERKQQWKIGGGIVKTTNATQTAMGRSNEWTSVIAAAVFCG